jgi:type I restriction enzyme S subunit
MAKLGEVCTIVSGSTPKTSVTSYWDGNIKWITPAELNEDTFYIMDSVRHITEEGKEKTGLSYLPAGTVILSSRAPIGKTAIAGCEMCCNQGFKNLICSDAIYNEYLYFFLKSKTDYLNSLGRGATFKEISKSIVESIEIPLPEVNQQKEIAEKFKKLEQLISLRKQQLAKLDELVKARFVEMFGDVLLNSMQWPEKTLENMADIVSGITKGRKTAEADLQEVPYMAVSNVKDGYIDWTTVKTILATRQEIEQYRLMPDDILMTEGGDPDKVGRGAIIKVPLKNSIHQNHIFRVRLDEQEILPSFFAEYLRHQKAKRYFLGCAKQTTGIASINMRQLRALPTLVPPLSLQKQFAAFVERVDQQKQTVQQSLEKLELMKNALMQEYFG